MAQRKYPNLAVMVVHGGRGSGIEIRLPVPVERRPRKLDFEVQPPGTTVAEVSSLQP